MPCSVCKQTGHNMRTCINMPWPPTDQTLLHAWRRRNNTNHMWQRFNRTIDTPSRYLSPSPSPDPSPSPYPVPVPVPVPVPTPTPTPYSFVNHTILPSERLVRHSELLIIPRRRRIEIPSDDTNLIPSAGRRWVHDPQWRRESDIESIQDNTSFQTPIIMELVDCVDKPCHIDECPICMEDLNLVDTFTTRCGHMFHGTCMLIHTQTKKSALCVEAL